MACWVPRGRKTGDPNNPSVTRNLCIGAFRAFFRLNEPGTVRAFVLNFGEDKATGIKDVERSTMNVQRDDAWFMLDGMKLQGKPTKKGLYIRNGRKVVIQ